MNKLHCRAYRLASKATVTALATQYNNKVKPEEQMDPRLIHSILSIIWVSQRKYEFGWLEADMSEGTEEDGYYQMSLAMKTVSLFGLEYPGLSQVSYVKFKRAYAELYGRETEEVDLHFKVYMVMLIIYGIEMEVPDLAKFGADILGASAGVDYARPFVGFIAESRNGNYNEARKEYEELKNSEQLKQHFKITLEHAVLILSRLEKGQELSEDFPDMFVDLFVKRIMTDIFAGEHKEELFEKIRQMPEGLLDKAKKLKQSPSTTTTTTTTTNSTPESVVA